MSRVYQGLPPFNTLPTVYPLWATCCARVPRVVLWYQCAVFITRSRQISNPKFEFESDPNSYQNYHALDFHFFQPITSSPNISFSQHQYSKTFLTFRTNFLHFLPTSTFLTITVLVSTTLHCPSFVFARLLLPCQCRQSWLQASTTRTFSLLLR